MNEQTQPLWYVDTKGALYTVEAPTQEEAFTELARTLPLEDAGILMVCYNSPFGDLEDPDPLVMDTGWAYFNAGVITKETLDYLHCVTLDRIFKGEFNDSE